MAQADDRLRQASSEAKDVELAADCAAGGIAAEPCHAQRLRRFASMPTTARPNRNAGRPRGFHRDALLERRRQDRRENREGDGLLRSQRRGHQLPASSPTHSMNRGDWAKRRATIESVQPFYVEPKMPLEVTQGRRAQLPVPLVNGTTDCADLVKVDSHARAEGNSHWRRSSRSPSTPRPADRRAAECRRSTMSRATVTFHIRATAGDYADDVTREADRQAARVSRSSSARGGLIGARRLGLVRDRDPGGRRARQRRHQHRSLPHAAGEHDPGAGGADPVAQRLLRADQLDDVSAGDGPAVFHVAQGRRSEADRARAASCSTKGISG